MNIPYPFRVVLIDGEWEKVEPLDWDYSAIQVMCFCIDLILSNYYYASQFGWTKEELEDIDFYERKDFSWALKPLDEIKALQYTEWLKRCYGMPQEISEEERLFGNGVWDNWYKSPHVALTPQHIQYQSGEFGGYPIIKDQLIQYEIFL